jgi:hypothetical protein
MIVYRVNWLRAKAQFKRWEEGKNVVRHEMVWTVNYFKHYERQWEERRKYVSDDREGADGLQCYAAKQAGLWRRFSKSAIAQFQVAIPDFHYSESL